jgi:KDO2-lipid IV(A) lauroyltransferase
MVRPVIQSLGSLLGFIAGSLLRIRRAHVVASMTRAGVANPNRAASAMYRALGISAVEFLFLGASENASADADVESSSRVSLAAARSLGRGLVIAASHTGNWDLAACAIAKELPLLVVTKRLKIRWIDAFWQNTRARLGVRLCEAAGAMSLARAQLAADGAVAMMIDQVPNKRSHAEEISFLGEPAFVDRAPATVAARHRAPLVVSAARRLKDGTQELAVLDVIVPPAHAGRAWIDEATLRATRALEKFVIENPSEWLWMHRRWRAPLS